MIRKGTSGKPESSNAPVGSNGYVYPVESIGNERDIATDGVHDDGMDDKNEDEQRNPKEAKIPTVPIAEEYRKHVLTHTRFQPWCSICVRNPAENKAHKVKMGITRSHIQGFLIQYQVF